MKVFTIKRTHYHAQGTFGVIDDEGTPFALTVEKEWKDNKPLISCIPVGEYQCSKIWSPKHQSDVFEVTNVPNRTKVEIHIANTEDDLEGCIGIGEEFGSLNGKLAVLGSARGYAEFITRVGDDTGFKLVILEWQ